MWTAMESVWRRERDSNFCSVLILNKLLKINGAPYAEKGQNAPSLYVYCTREGTIVTL